MFLYFRQGAKGKLISKMHGKTALIHSGNLLKPGLAEVEIVEEASRYVLVRILNEAAMLEMLESGEERSVRLTTARRLFGDYHIRAVTRKADEPMVTFYWRGISQEIFDLRLQVELKRHQPPLPRRRWTK
jgi:hypothetical protein